MLKILQARLQQYMNQGIPDVEAGFRKDKGTRGWIANILWIIEKSKRIPEKSLLCWYTKTFDCVDDNKLWKILKSWEYQSTWPASWEICMQVKKQQLEPNMEQWTGSKVGKKYVKAIHRHTV